MELKIIAVVVVVAAVALATGGRLLVRVLMPAVVVPAVAVVGRGRAANSRVLVVLVSAVGVVPVS